MRFSSIGQVNPLPVKMRMMTMRRMRRRKMRKRPMRKRMLWTKMMRMMPPAEHHTMPMESEPSHGTWGASYSVKFETRIE